MTRKTTSIVPGVLAALLVLFAGAAGAEDAYPNRAIHFIVGFAAGGGNDIFARLVVQKFQENTGATAVIENKVGAGGRIAAEYAARAAADGYTVLVGATGQMSIAAAIYPNLAYHPTKSFIPLNMIASFPLVLVVPADHPAKSVKELVAWAKANPDKSNYGTSSPSFTIASELLKLKTGMPAVAIPYKSSNESNLCVVSGAVSVHHFRWAAGDPAGQRRQDPRSGGDRLRALAGTSRSSEHGGSRLSRTSTPICGAAFSCRPELRRRSSTSSPRNSAARLPIRACRSGLKKMAVTPGGPTGDAFKKLIDADIKSFGDVVKAAKLTFPQ